MKAILEFDLPDDAESFMNASRVDEIVSAIWVYSQELRTMYKYGDKDTIRTQEARALLFKIFNERSLDTDML